jgi:hypothetical protein
MGTGKDQSPLRREDRERGVFFARIAVIRYNGAHFWTQGPLFVQQPPASSVAHFVAQEG